MGIDDMVIVIEKYLEEAGFENVKERYLNNKSDEVIRFIYETTFNDLNK